MVILKEIIIFFRDIYRQIDSMAVTVIRLILLGFAGGAISLGLGLLLSRFFPIHPATAAFLVAGIAIGAGILDRLTSIAVDLWDFLEDYRHDHDIPDRPRYVDEDDELNGEEDTEDAFCPSCREKLIEQEGGFFHQKEIEGKPWRTSVGRNDPCPCGSGRKYKKCCKISPSF